MRQAGKCIRPMIKHDKQAVLIYNFLNVSKQTKLNWHKRMEVKCITHVKFHYRTLCMIINHPVIAGLVSNNVYMNIYVS